MAIITFLLLAQIVSLVGAKALNYKPSVLKFLKPGANSRSSVCADLDGFLFSGLNCTSLVLNGGCLSNPIINASCPASCGYCDFNQTRHAKAIQTDTEMDVSLAACCIEEGVPQNCNICSFSSTVSSLVQAGLGCIPYVDKFASCAADGHDSTDCCKIYYVPTLCYGFCKGEVTVVSSALLPCITFMPQILGCLKLNYTISS